MAMFYFNEVFEQGKIVENHMQSNLGEGGLEKTYLIITDSE
jgi:hypothetical protein